MSFLRRLWRALKRFFGAAVAVTPVVKILDGYFLDENQVGIPNATITADLSDRVINSTDRAVYEIEGHVEATTNDDGYWQIPLRPNNVTGDQPQDTRWTITEPGGHTETIFVDATAAHGDTAEDPLAYTALITAPGAGTPPVDWEAQLSALAATVTANTNALALLASAGDMSTLSLPTDLVDLANQAGTAASHTSSGYMSATDYDLLQTFKTSGSNDTALLARYATSGANKYLILPSAAEPTDTGTVGWAYTSATDGQAKIQKGTSVGRTRVAPGLKPISWQATSNITSSSNTTWTTLGSFDVAANAFYLISGPLNYQSDALVDLEIGFTGIPSGATLAWFYMGAAATVPSGGETTSTVNPTLRTGTQTLTFGGTGTSTMLGAYVVGVLRTGTNVGTISQQFRKNNNQAGNAVVLANSAVFFDQWS